MVPFAKGCLVGCSSKDDLSAPPTYACLARIPQHPFPALAQYRQRLLGENMACLFDPCCRKIRLTLWETTKPQSSFLSPFFCWGWGPEGPVLGDACAPFQRGAWLWLGLGSVTQEKGNRCWGRGRPFLVGQPPKKRKTGATEQLSG